MTEHLELRLARLSDAKRIATMSRELIEHGLGWSWTPDRVANHIRRPDTVVLAAKALGGLVGFAIMYFGEEDAHLNLLAVSPLHRRTGIGRRLMRWLERSAGFAGICAIHVEVRASNRSAQSFYRSLGYRPVGLWAGYYCGREAAVRMSRTLRSVRWSELDMNDAKLTSPLKPWAS
ncbi:MAG: GNAT family N-acetyltransferase [Gammaproteobacteria bacterium]